MKHKYGIVLPFAFICVVACSSDDVSKATDDPSPESSSNSLISSSSDLQTSSSSELPVDQSSSSEFPAIPEFFEDSCTASGGQFLYGACICRSELCDIAEACNPETGRCANFVEEECPVDINERTADSAHYYRFNVYGGCQIIGAYDGSDSTESFYGVFYLLRNPGGLTMTYTNLLASLGIYNREFVGRHGDIDAESVHATVPITKAQLKANVPDFFNAFYPDTAGHERTIVFESDLNEDLTLDLIMYCDDKVFGCKSMALELGCKEAYIDHSEVLAVCDLETAQKMQMRGIILGINRPEELDVLLPDILD